MLAALSIQLALYSAAWFLIGRTFGLERQAVWSWSLAWTVLAVATGVLASPLVAKGIDLGFFINTAVVSAFVMLMWGSAQATHIPVKRAHIWGPVALVGLVNLFRFHWYTQTSTLRWILFVVCIAWPIGLMAIRLSKALTRLDRRNLTSMVWAPIVVVVCFFTFRSYLLVSGQNPQQLAFSGESLTDLIGISLFFISLGAFNFALATYVIGRMARRLSDLSNTDQLTGLANRRYLMRQCELEDARFHRTRRPYAIMLFDLDHFKKVNDTYGHDIGDKVLIEVSETLSAEVRNNDVMARYGGEEFLLLMPETELEAAQHLAERIRHRVLALKVDTGDSELSVTLSGGISCATQTDKSAEQVIKRADEALYQAKNEGRNRIVIARNEAS